ncbi:MAG: folylpolyglutamate synthase/dihydrofolate synthase family protein [Kineosporiaceae bacterium]
MTASPRPDRDDPAVEQDYRRVTAAILGRAPEHDLVPSLTRIAHACRLMGDPQHAFRAVHVTGTNGKTSTTRMIERLLREQGLRTGRFVSPHLTEPRERIAVDGVPLGRARFVEVYDEVIPYVELVDAADPTQPRMTFFEVLVAMAYAAFADAPVDVAVVEVGMGGAWDATNVIDAEVSVVMPVAIDHERFLGHDLASIATEKAGIIKPGGVAVLAEQDPEAAVPLLERAASVGARVAREGIDFGLVTRDVAVGGQLVSLQGLGRRYDDVFLPLHGVHQARNAAAALAATEALLGARPADGGSDAEGDTPALDPEVVIAAFAGVDSPGRLEIVRRSPTILVDAAHNPAGAAVLAEALRESFTFSRLVGLVAILEDKDAEGILSELEPVLDEIVLTRSSSGRARDVQDLAELAGEVFGEHRVTVAERLDHALDVAVARAELDGVPGSAVLATGSITLVGDVRVLLGKG